MRMYVRWLGRTLNVIVYALKSLGTIHSTLSSGCYLGVGR